MSSDPSTRTTTRADRESGSFRTLDWLAATALIIDRSQKALAILDEAGRIRLSNPAFQRLTGFRSGQLECLPWASGLEGTERARPPWLDLALRGVLHQQQCEIQCASGERLLLELSLTPLGRGSDQGLVVEVEDARAVGAIDPVPPADPDFNYEISTKESDFGRVIRIVRLGALITERSLGGVRRCYEVLAGADSPCEDCPLRRLEQGGAPEHVMVRPGGDPTDFRLVAVEATGAERALIRVRAVSESAISALLAARVRALSKRARLSRREESVLSCLLLGRSCEEIAAVLKISRRTVRFHQANVLAKVGAESRIDLMRLIL